MTRDRRAIPATCACLLIVSLMSVPSVRAVGEGDTPGNDRNHAASAPDPMELEFFSLVNQSRAAAQLPLLRADDTLSAFTRSHTRDMVERRGLFHSAEEARMAVAAAGWQRLGENVGVGSSPETLHDAFMGSSHHRDNILGDYDGIAIGADRGDDGRLYVTVVFVK